MISDDVAIYDDSYCTVGESELILLLIFVNGIIMIIADQTINY